MEMVMVIVMEMAMVKVNLRIEVKDCGPLSWSKSGPNSYLRILESVVSAYMAPRLAEITISITGFSV